MKRKSPLLTLFFLALAGFISVLSFRICPVNAASDSPGIAVLAFKDSHLANWWSWSWDVGDGITTLVTNDLVARNKYTVLERSRISEILAEKNLILSGDVDLSTAVQIGKLIGAKLVILGDITSFNIKSSSGVSFGGISVKGSKAKVSLSARVVSVQTAQILGSSNGEGESTGASFSVDTYRGLSFESSEYKNTTLGKATSKAVKSLTDQLCSVLDASIGKLEGKTSTLEGSLASLKGDLVIINIGSNKGVKIGQIFQVYHLEKVEGMSKPVRVPVGTIKIISVDPDAAVGKWVSKEGDAQVGDTVALT
ncbi:MAG: CsgG/HfaB family protein [Bacillota bacterium]